MSEELEVEPENKLVAYQPQSPSLFGTADPVEVVAKAARVAGALQQVIREKGLISKISGKEYPRCEAWTLLGTMLGVFPVLSWTRPIDGGWEARVEARTRDGAIVGAAEAECLRSERNWAKRDDFALRSMAQTRATAKALRMPLGFVMTLGGFEATPAEEMLSEEPKKPEKAAPPAKVATEKYRARFLAVMRQSLEENQIWAWATARNYITTEQALHDWPLDKVPIDKGQLDAMLADCLKFAKGSAKPQSELETKTTAAGITFDQFRKWAIATGNLEDGDTYADFQALPAKKALHFLTNLRTIIETLRPSQ